MKTDTSTHSPNTRYNPYAVYPIIEKNTTINKKYYQQKINQNVDPNNDFKTMDPEQKMEGLTRIMYGNINGINVSNQDKIREITEYMKTHEVDMIGMSETNTHWNNGNVYKGNLNKIRRELNDKKATLHTSDTLVEWSGKYKPGGTAIIVKSQISSQIIRKSNDNPMGRWSAITIGQKKQKITIITAYIVCNTPITLEKNSTAAYQQWTRISIDDGSQTQKHPRKKAIKELKLYLENEMKQGHDIILMMDLNEFTHRKNGIVEEIENAYDMSQLSFNATAQNIVTYKRGKHQIDTMMVSNSLLPFVHNSNILAFDRVCQSDHSFMYMDININEYIQNISNIQEPLPRALHSNKPNEVLKYKTQVYNAMQAKEIQDKIETITRKMKECNITEDDANTINDIDMEFTRARLTAENTLRKNLRNDKPWSPKIMQAYLRVQLWCALKHQLKTGSNRKMRIQTIEEKLNDPPLQKPTSYEEVRKQCIKAKKILRQIEEEAVEIREDFLWQQAEASEIEGNISASKAIKQLINTEKMKWHHQKLTYFFKRKLDCSLKAIQIKK